MATVTASSANRRRSAVRPGGSLRKKARAVRRFFAADAACACAVVLPHGPRVGSLRQAAATSAVLRVF